MAGNVTTGDGASDPGRGGGVLVEGSATLTNSTVSGNTARRGRRRVRRRPRAHTRRTRRSRHPTPAAACTTSRGRASMRSTLVAGNQGTACSGQPGGGERSTTSPTTPPAAWTGQEIVWPARRSAPLARQRRARRGRTRSSRGARRSTPVPRRLPGQRDQRQVARTGPTCDIGAFEGSIAGGGPPQPPPGRQSCRRRSRAKSVNALPKSGTVRVKLPGREPVRRARGGPADPGRDDGRHPQGPRDARRRGRPARPTSTTASSGSARARAPSR